MTVPFAWATGLTAAPSGTSEPDSAAAGPGSRSGAPSDLYDKHALVYRGGTALAAAGLSQTSNTAVCRRPGGTLQVPTKSSYCSLTR